MSIFKPVTLGFAGKNYTIPANEIMECLALMEEVITLADLSNQKSVRVVRLSRAYGIALRYAGADVTDEEVYESVFTKTGVGFMASAVSGLLSMMIPPSKLQASVKAGTNQTKKPTPKNKN